MRLISRRLGLIVNLPSSEVWKLSTNEWNKGDNTQIYELNVYFGGHHIGISQFSIPRVSNDENLLQAVCADAPVAEPYHVAFYHAVIDRVVNTLDDGMVDLEEIAKEVNMGRQKKATAPSSAN